MPSVLLRACASTDGVMFLSLAYLAADTAVDWESFSRCRWPVHKWLLVSYMSAAACRAAHLLGTRFVADGGVFLLNLRPEGKVSRALLLFSWLLGLPFFTLWTLMGTVIVADVSLHGSECLPAGTTPWFLVFWQVLSYVWICVHVFLGVVAVLLERRLRRMENDLRQIEDPDVLARWGQVSRVSGFGALPWVAGSGLSPSEIAELPCQEAGASECGEECAVCLSEVQAGDVVRCIPGCGHTYHRACIDLWLLRRSDCPLCKGSARARDRDAARA